ncbi:tetratricopeptide repeat protein [Ramlibacter pallidus]|uniref:Tetratricopeptide repeat protein n=1 Tax=Ramlibacter pallidus TaxID=2780087 RepID=A0ABR9S1M7_9BURK|nr:tetratricopeptide repeat protein [Ramlibacter pallidus]MBE7367421.1 tetratricopeptide repeat protein [Ramlibacter pallidus]
MKTLIKNLLGTERRQKETLRAAIAAADAAGQPAEAIAARRAWLAVEPSDAATWLSLAERLRREGQRTEAVDAYERALAAGADAVPVLLSLGALQTELERFSDAEQSFRRLVAIDPKHADAWCMLGVVTKEQARYEDALRHFGEALALQPAFAEAHFNLGLAQFELGRLQEASASFMRCAELRRGKPWTGDRAALLGHDPLPRLEAMDMGVNEVKLRHDCEQLEYLLQGGHLPAAFTPVLDDYRALWTEIRGKVDEHSLVPFDPGRHPLVARTYKRPIHIAQVAPPDVPIINPALDFEDIQDRYLAAQPNVLAIDGLLTPEALQAMRRFCRESTFWNNIKSGYLGAYFFDGFCSELLLRLAAELRRSMPRVIRDLPLQMMWGYKCDCTLPGLGLHADAAAVNVNFWITEEEANLDPEGGGLLVYEHNAPEAWDFRKFNHDSGQLAEYLSSIGSVPTRYPYRANRAVMFDSDLFHATDHPRFREGYLNRRINITLLYGNRLG